MKSRTAYVSLLLGSAAALGGTIAIAEGDVAALEGGTPAAAEGASPKSPQQILDESRASVDRMEATADNISRLLRGAREQKDVVKALCLDDKMNQVDVAVRAAADRLAIIESSVSSGSTERLEHDQSVLSALTARGGELAVEANQCIGEESGSMGDAELKVTFDPAIPEGDVSTPQTPAIISATPQAASPITPD